MQDCIVRNIVSSFAALYSKSAAMEPELTTGESSAPKMFFHGSPVNNVKIVHTDVQVGVYTTTSQLVRSILVYTVKSHHSFRSLAR